MVETARLRKDRRDNASREGLVQRIYGEFKEMPCLRLTDAQARRLFGLSPEICERVFAGLVREGLLVRGHDRRYRLNTAGS
jgi:hypothetical protein